MARGITLGWASAELSSLYYIWRHLAVAYLSDLSEVVSRNSLSRGGTVESVMHVVVAPTEVKGWW